MDSITQAALGAAIGISVSGKKIGGKTAAVIGAILGTVPDLDILLLPLYDGLERISVHRGFSHSILFSLLGAFLFATILRKVKWTKEESFLRLWLFSFLALVTHILLDTFTSYGTQLFLPFTDWRVSFDSICIVDPFYTIPLLAGALATVFNAGKTGWRGLPNTIGLIVSSLYLVYTLVNKQCINSVFQTSLEARHVKDFRLLTVPVTAGNGTWYGVARSGDSLHLAKYSEWKGGDIHFHTFPINEQLLEGLDTHLADRMKWFAQGFYTVTSRDGKIRIYNLQVDMQGIREDAGVQVPTAFYFEIMPKENGAYDLETGMHRQATK